MSVKNSLSRAAFGRFIKLPYSASVANRRVQNCETRVSRALCGASGPQVPACTIRTAARAHHASPSKFAARHAHGRRKCPDDERAEGLAHAARCRARQGGGFAPTNGRDECHRWAIRSVSLRS
jgi:hypothetical protein